MGQPDAAALLPLAESIADGSPIDWHAAEARASADEQGLIRQLRILAELATLHRTLPISPDALSNTLAARRASTAPAIGLWAHLDLIERIGGGTFGEVYRAWDRHLEREVALKLLHAADTADDPYASRIVTEGRLLARVRHPNVVAVHGVAAHDGRVGLWMELVDGPTLEQVLLRSGPFNAGEAALVGIDLCRALAAVHRAGLVHRDIKAQNVLREHGGRIVLMDLGTSRRLDPARPAASPDLAGTPLYLAPEIFDGAPASERTDLYSLGVLLYHLVTGAFPVRAATIAELQAAHAKRAAVRLRDARPDLPTPFVRVVDRAIATNPDERYGSAGELEADLVKALDDSSPPRAASVEARQSSRLRIAWWSTAAAAIMVVVVLALVATPWRTSRAKPTSITPGLVRSIAVLPLVNLSGDPSQEYFADGMTDELIGTLGQLGGVNVISRTSAMQFKGSKRPLPDIAGALHVDAVLEGSVMVVTGNRDDRSAEAKRVRINARLIYAGSDTQLWDKTFEAVVDDVLALQSDVAKAVAEGIDLRLTTRQQSSLARAHRENAQAQDAYLQGRYLLMNSTRRDDLIRSRGYLERAVQIDPGYARASAALARCYALLDVYGVLTLQEAPQLVGSAARAAVRIDASLPEAQAEFAHFAHVYEWDWATAESAYRRAIELNPSYSLAHADYARFLMAEGRLDEALQHAQLAEQQDPLSTEASAVVAITLYYQRRYDEALAQRLKAVQLDPNSAAQHLGLGQIYAAKSDFDRAVSELQRAIALSGRAPYIQAELAHIYAASGRQREARALMTSLINASKGSGRHLAAQYPAYMYAALGDHDRAFEWLNKAVDDREPSVLWGKVDPRLDPLRRDPRFEAFLARIGPRQ